MVDTAPTTGVHVGVQRTTVAELQPLWRRIEELGFGFISVWDHLDTPDGTGSHENLEAITTHTALAMSTERVQVGSLVYAVGLRHPAVLARAIANIDRISGGRAALGLGAGWLAGEFLRHGLPYGTPGERVRQLDEALGLVRRLLDGEEVTFAGEHYAVDAIRCYPTPVQSHLPITVGGSQPKMLRVIARHADAWNVPFLSPDAWAAKRTELLAACDEVGRDPATLRCTANVGLAVDEANLAEQFGVTAEFVRPGVLMGSDAQMRDHLAAYREAGAVQVNLAIRAPFDVAVIERFAAIALP